VLYFFIMRTKLYVGNLPVNITEDTLLSLFSEAGVVVSVSIIPGKNPRRKKSSAYVTFATRAGALKAIRMFRGFTLDNRKLKLSEEAPLRYSSLKGLSPGGRGIARIQGLPGGLTGDATTDAPPPEPHPTLPK